TCQSRVAHVLGDLSTLALSRATEIDRVRVSGLDGDHQGPELVLLGIDALVADDFHPELVAAALKERRESLPIELLVVQDEYGLGLQFLLGEVGRERTLRVVRRTHAPEGDLPSWSIDA